jgi:hypothetical protein
MGKAKEAVSDYGLDTLGLAASVVDQLTNTNFASMATDSIGGVIDLADCKGSPEHNPNPLFIANGHDALGNHSPNVKKYLRKRKWKKFGGSAVSLAGNIGSIATLVNTSGAARHARAETKTIAHIVRLNNISKQFKQSRYLTDLCNALLKMKTIKAGARGGALAADLIPVALASGLVGAGAAVGGAIAVKRQKNLVLQTALQLHWRAYQEIKLTAIAGGTGPAMRMVRELFGQTVRHGEVDWSKPDNYIKEPSGWMVIQDKLNLI